jgi:hypothetical protein
MIAIETNTAIRHLHASRRDSILAEGTFEFEEVGIDLGTGVGTYGMFFGKVDYAYEPHVGLHFGDVTLHSEVAGQDDVVLRSSGFPGMTLESTLYQALTDKLEPMIKELYDVTQAIDLVNRVDEDYESDNRLSQSAFI